ncbi:MAG: endonuclease [Bacteroidia bacterium]|nr:endonuclease [Bacteroidia bacterium]
MRKQLLSTGLVLLFLGLNSLFAQTPPPGISGQAFRDWIKTNFYDGFHTTLGYSTARGYMYGYIDNDNGTLTGVYSGYQLSWAYGNTGTNPAPINAEHTVPQSFFGSAEPMRSDIHHLFPTYGNWNSTRSNYPFADIDDNTTTKWMYLDQEQTSIPSSNIDFYSEYANQEFEPREDHKGDCARAIFYFYTMYPTQAGAIASVGDLNMLYQWHLQDPPDTDEIMRNISIETYQGNRNPFVDNPDWVADAWEISTSGPATPGNFQLVAGASSLNLSWTDVANETGYNLYRSTDNVNFSLLANPAADAVSYSDGNVSQGSTYYYYIEAFNATGTSSGSNIISGQTQGGSGGSATDLLISEYIEGSSFNKALEVANFTGSTVSLSGYVLKKQTNGAGAWGSDYALSGSLAQGDVFVIANSSADPTILAQADVNTGSGIVTFNGNDAIGLFKNGTLIDILGTFNSASNYAQDVTLVRKSSIDSPNNIYTTSEWDSYASNTFTDLGSHTFNGGSGTNPPAAPANVQLVATTTSLDLSWDDLSDETGYTLYRSTDNVNFSSLASLGANVVSYSDAGLSLETTYYYYLEAFNSAGSSPASSTVSGATLPQAPAAPANVDLIATTIDLNISWDDLANEDGYLIYRSDDNSNFSQIASLAADEIGYTDNTIQLLTTYYYYVVAFNAGGNSPNSSTVSGQTEFSGPAASDLLISEYIEGSSFNKALEIANNTGATVDMSAYVLKKQTNGSGAWGSDYALSGNLSQGSVFVIANSSANASILAEADISTGSGIVTFNGNDAIGLFKNGILIDMLGTFNSAATYAQDVTLVRKASVDSPVDVYNSGEWDVFATDNSSDLGSHTFNGGGLNPPASPANIALTATTSDLSLSWDDVTNEDGYIVYRSSDNLNFSQLASLASNATSYTDNSITLLTTYYYYLVAFNADGNSANSSTVSGQTEDNSPTASEVFISEYVEGSQRNRAIEIANFTGASVDLGQYSLKRQANGGGNWRNTFSLSGTLQDGEVFVLGHSSASSGITSVADQLTSSGIMNFSGNDPIGLFKNNVLIDIVGTFNGGNGNFARNTTLVRKASVTDPTTNYTLAEWDAYGSNTFSFLGAHTFGNPPARLAEENISAILIQEVKAWPNPFYDQLIVNYEISGDTEVEMDIYSLTGQRVKLLKSPGFIMAGQHQQKLDLGEIPAGIYLLRLRSSTDQKVIRIVKR